MSKLQRGCRSATTATTIHIRSTLDSPESGESRPLIFISLGIGLTGRLCSGVVEKTKTNKKEPNSAVTAAKPNQHRGQPNTRASEETRKWFDSLEFVLEYVLKNQGSDQASFFVDNLV